MIKISKDSSLALRIAVNPNLEDEYRDKNSGVRHQKLKLVRDDRISTEGLIITQTMSPEIYALHELIRAVNKGIGILQETNSTLVTIKEMVLAIKALKEKAQTCTDTEMFGILGEYRSLLKQIKEAPYNEESEVNLLIGNKSYPMVVGVAHPAAVTIDIDLSELNCTPAKLGFGHKLQNQNLKSDSESIQTAIENALTLLDARHAYLGSIQSRLEAILEKVLEEESKTMPNSAEESEALSKTVQSQILEADWTMVSKAQTNLYNSARRLLQ